MVGASTEGVARVIDLLRWAQIARPSVCRPVSVTMRPIPRLEAAPVRAYRNTLACREGGVTSAYHIVRTEKRVRRGWRPESGQMYQRENEKYSAGGRSSRHGRPHSEADAP